MGLAELRAKLDAKKEEIRGFIKEQKADEAEKAMEEKRNLEKLIKAAEDMEEEEKRDLESQKKKKNEKTEETNEFRAIVKTVMGEEATVEERENITSVDNAAVIPKQFVNQLIEIQKGFGSLKGLCDIIPVTKNEGTIPVVDLDQNDLPDVLEGEDIVDGTFVTTDVPFKCAKVGLIQSITSETIDDAEVEIEGLVKKNFANIATAKENFKILKVIKDNATAIVGATSYEDVEKAIDGSLPAVKAGLVTLTNVTGYVHLKNKKDENGRPLNLITEVNGVEYFHGKPIVTVEDTSLPVSEGKTQVFYIANMKEAVKYCDRKAVTIARSTEAGFRDDTVKIRILERFIPVKGSARSIKKIEF
jgi:HK97 family phage major capsid protein